MATLAIRVVIAAVITAEEMATPVTKAAATVGVTTEEVKAAVKAENKSFQLPFHYAHSTKGSSLTRRLDPFIYRLEPGAIVAGFQPFFENLQETPRHSAIYHAVV